jgi:KUP system potassium uptake protein
VTIRLGFRIENRVNVCFRQIVQDMVSSGEVNIASRYSSLSKMNINGDFRFVVQERYLSYDNNLPYFSKLILYAYYFIKHFSYSTDRWYGLDAGSVTTERVPLVINPINEVRIKRIK